jgi:hypothetical protein
METEKKKSGKLKKIVIVIVVVVVLLYIIGKAGGDDGEGVSSSEAGGTTQTEATAQDSQETGQTGENASDDENSDSASASETSDSRHQVGETVIFTADNGGEISITLTDWGTTHRVYDDDTPALYVKYEIENVGNKDVTIGGSLFNVYADNYNVGTASVLSEYEVGDVIYARTLSSGRKVDGALYKDVNPADVSVIEVEVGSSVFVLKDDSKE